MPSFLFPGGKRFAFTVIDDTDVATVENIRPIYQLLADLGLRCTKTVWPMPCPEGSKNFGVSQTLGDPEYREFVVDIQRAGFEIGWHGATMESSNQQRTLAGLERFKEVFGHYPRVHTNHASNRENIYWGTSRIDRPLLKYLYGRAMSVPPDYYLGHVDGSRYWWGDLCARHIHYVRNLTFNDINLARINPSMPYHDPMRPLVGWWFSATNAEDVLEFNDLLSEHNQDRLEKEAGICVVATHFGKGFVQGGKVLPVTQEKLTTLAQRPGWFPTVSELLDWLRAQRASDILPPREWNRMQRRWALDRIQRRLIPRRRA